MSETNDAAALKAVTKERDDLAAKVKGLQADLVKAGEASKAVTKERDDHKASIAEIHTALGIGEDGDPLAEVEKLLSTPVPLDGGGLELFKPEEKGTRRYGSEATPERFIAIEEISFEQDLGFGFDVIQRRAESMVKRCVEAAHSPDKALGKLPDFRDGKRVLLVTLEVK